LQPLAHLLIERTQGNPLYIEESVRTLVESGALGGERGNYHLLRLLSTIDMPATVQAILAARIDRLSSEDKRLLQTASVIGKDVPFALLQAVGDPSEDQVRARISHLQSAEFLYELHLFPDLEYTFKHALTHEVTYASLLSERRKLLHRRSLEAIEQVYADRLVEHIDRLAHHAYRAEAWDQAVTYSRVAAERALRRLATREALAAVEQALSALPHLPQTRENLEQAVDIRLLARIPLTQLNEQRRMHAVMSETEMLARRLGDPLRLGWALTAICHSAANTGRTEEALEYGAEATALAHQVGNAGLGIASNFFYGLAFMFAGRYPEALQLLGQCRLAGERIEPEHASTATPSAITLYGPYLRTLADAYAAWCLMERGEFEEAVNRAECAVSSSEAMGMAYATCLAQAFFGAVHLRRGSFDRAIALLEVSVDAARRSTSPFAQMLCSSRLGYAYAMVNRVAEGISMLEAARDLGDSSGERTWTPLTYSYLGEAYSLDGNYREAAACTFRGVELARGAKQRGCEAWGLHALAGVLTQCNQGDTCEPEQHYRSALALAEELRMRPLIAHCRLGLGELEKRMGQPLAAREDVKIAAAMFREMGMHRWIERTELVRAHI
jgi:tetratricopeptide (TPR) repeat protein